MAWKVFAERLLTADFSGSPTHSARAVFTNDIALKAVRTWVVLFNAPIFTQLEMRIYSNLSNAPDILLHTFDTTWQLSDISDQDYAVREIYFNSAFAFPILSGETYHFVLWPTGYTGDETSHIGWVRTLDDPTYAGYTPDMKELNASPYRMAYIGARA